MTDPTRSTGGDDGGMEYDGESTGLPRWVKLTGLAVAVIVVLVVVIMLMGGLGGHGPQRHGGAGDSTPPATIGVGRWRLSLAHRHHRLCASEPNRSGGAPP